MPRLSRDTLLSIHLGAILSRNRYTKDPAPVIAELIATAGDRVDVLNEAAGTWVGFYEDDYVRVLCAALRELPGLEPWIAVGANRRAQPDHRTPTAHAGAAWPARACSTGTASRGHTQPSARHHRESPVRNSSVT